MPNNIEACMADAFKRLSLEEADETPVAVIDSEPSSIVPAEDDLNVRLVSKVDVLSKALARALEENGFGRDIDPKLIKRDIIRDCGLMGGVVSTSELDVESNPFDAETKRMHDMGPVDTSAACQELLRVTPEEFVGRIIQGLRGSRGRIGGPRMSLPNSAPRRLR